MSHPLTRDLWSFLTRQCWPWFKSLNLIHYRPSRLLNLPYTFYIWVRIKMATLLHVDPRQFCSLQCLFLLILANYCYILLINLAHIYSFWLIATHFASLLLIWKNSTLTFRPSMPRKRAGFIICAQIGIHTPVGKIQNKNKKQIQKQKQKQGVFLDEKLS